MLLRRHGSCSSFSHGTNAAQLRGETLAADRALCEIATALMDVIRKQRFGSVLVVSRATRHVWRPAMAVASVAPRPGTHRPVQGDLPLPARGCSPLCASLTGGEEHVKRTVHEKSTRRSLVVGCGRFLFTGSCWARATKQRIFFREENARELRRIAFRSVVVRSLELNGVPAAWSG